MKFLQERVPQLVLQDLGPGKNQKPFAVVEGYPADELIISVRDTKAAGLQPYVPDMSHSDRCSQQRRFDRTKVDGSERLAGWQNLDWHLS